MQWNAFTAAYLLSVLKTPRCNDNIGRNKLFRCWEVLFDSLSGCLNNVRSSCLLVEHLACLKSSMVPEWGYHRCSFNGELGVKWLGKWESLSKWEYSIFVDLWERNMIYKYEQARTSSLQQGSSLYLNLLLKTPSNENEARNLVELWY